MLLASCCAFMNPQVLLAAFGTTALVTVCLTVYAFVTKTDFTGCGPYLCCMLFVLIIIGLLTTFKLFPPNLYAYIGVGMKIGCYFVDRSLLALPCV